MTTYTAARGLRNRNPGNLRHSQAFTWRGEIAPDSDGYCRFGSAPDGLRALALDLLTKWRRGLRSVRAIVAVYAPPAENPTQNYVANVAAALAVRPDETIDLTAIGTLAVFVKAVVRQECGSVPFTVDDLLAAARDATALPHPAPASVVEASAHG
jgi:hypothetical protein